VADSGDKIPKEIQATIFDPFICGDESRNTEGSWTWISYNEKLELVKK